VSLSAASTSPVTVNYATQNGSATAGSDYQAQSGTLSFAAGETTKTVRIAIYGDSTIEPDEWFQLVLSDPSGNAVISDPLGIGTIVNDDVLRGNGKKK
jgi:chitinase